MFSSLLRAMTPAKQPPQQEQQQQEQQQEQQQQQEQEEQSKEATKNSDNDNDTDEDATISIPALWQLLDRELRVNIGTSVKCGICLSTVVQPMRTPCVHSFCKSCILASLHATSKCPECNTRITKRSLQSFDYLSKLAANYKQQLIDFGFCPSQPMLEFTTLTQKNADDTQDDNDMLSPQRVVDRLHVATTWQQQALPMVQPPAIQINENQLVVQANQRACRGLPLPLPLNSVNTVNTVNASVNANASVLLPNTQDLQEQAREQQLADQEWREQEQNEDGSSQLFATPREFGSEPMMATTNVDVHVDARQQRRVRFPERPPLPTTTVAQIPKEDAPPIAATATRTNIPSPFATPLSPIEKQQPQQEQQDVAAASVVVVDGDEPPSPSSPKDVNVTGLLEDSFGALHWTNDDRPTQDEYGYHEGGPPLTMTQGDNPISLLCPMPRRNSNSNSNSQDNDDNDNDAPVDEDAKEEEGAPDNKDEDEDITASADKDENFAASTVEDNENAFAAPPVEENDNGDDFAASVEDNDNDLEDPVEDNDKDDDFPDPVKDNDNDLEDPVEDNDKDDDFPDPVDDNDHADDFVAPVEDNDNADDFAAPVKDNDNDFVAPVEVNDNDFAAPVEDNDKDFPDPIDDDNEKDFAVAPVDDDKDGEVVAPVDDDNEGNDFAAPIDDDDDDDDKTQELRASQETTSPDNRKQQRPPKRPLSKKVTQRRSRRTTPTILEDDDDKDTNPTAAAAVPPTFTPVSPSESSTTTESPKTNRPDTEPTTAARQEDETPSDDEDETTRIPHTSSSSWTVGTIVEVQSRTWPGVNKPGGVARITKCEEDGTYNVSYILGGRESHVDAVFLQIHSNEKTRRTETEWPKSLLQALAAQGFDTGIAVTAAAASSSSNDKVKKEGTTNPTPAENNKKNQKKPSLALKDCTNRKTKRPKSSDSKAATRKRKTDSATKPTSSTKTTTAAASTSRKRKSAEKEQAPTQQASTSRKRKSVEKKQAPKQQGTTASTTKAATTTTSTRKRKSAEKDNVTQELAPANKASSTKRKSRTTTTPKRRGTSCPPPPKSKPLPVWSTEETCQRADERYRERFQAALNEKVVHMVASNLPDRDMDILRALCSKTLSGDVKLKLSDSFGKKTTLCIVPMDEHENADGNLTPRVRTLKAMRSLLAGIPIVSPEWIQACGEQNAAVVPTCARSLPTKMEAIHNKGDAHYGVAKLAALLHHAPKPQEALPLHNMCVYLCGNFPQTKKTDIQRLSKEAGAKVLTCPSAVAAKLTKKSSHHSVVLVCHDSTSGTVIPSALEKEIKNNPSCVVMVVNPNWVFDSITCARAMPTDAFEPTNPKAKELWRFLRRSS